MDTGNTILELSSENVEDLFKACLSKGGKEVEGVNATAKLDTTGNEKKIYELLRQLPTEFHKGQGGGWSFLNSIVRSDGVQWTGLHQTADMLVMLGLASGQVVFLLPRDMWSALPGGMPYFLIVEKEKEYA